MVWLLILIGIVWYVFFYGMLGFVGEKMIVVSRGGFKLFIVLGKE